jgi:hypothetical protein
LETTTVITARTALLALAAALTFGLTGCALPSDVATPTDAAAAPAATSKHTPKAKPKPKTTVAQRNALRSAQSYIDLSGFSRKGLMGQLTSKAGEGFSRADATYGVKHVKVDWNDEAVESAKSYLEFSSFSRAGLINQLESSAGSGFTHKQAVYAVKKVGL